MSSNVAWLFPYWKHSLKHYYAELSLPQGRDACLHYSLGIKQQDGYPLNDKEETQYKSMVDIAYDFKSVWEAGFYISPSDMPTKMFAKPFSDSPIDLPHESDIAFKIDEGYLIINQTFYEILSKARLGKTHFSQVHFYNIVTQELLTDTPYYFINIAEQREWADTANSQQIAKNPYNPYIPTYSIYFPETGDIKLSNQAKNPEIDIWCDPQFNQSFFMSDRLVNQLIEAGITKEQLRLVACEII